MRKKLGIRRRLVSKCVESSEVSEVCLLCDIVTETCTTASDDALGIGLMLSLYSLSNVLYTVVQVQGRYSVLLRTPAQCGVSSRLVTRKSGVCHVVVAFVRKGFRHVA